VYHKWAAYPQIGKRRHAKIGQGVPQRVAIANAGKDYPLSNLRHTEVSRIDR
jgi:hypothetical protein